MRTAAYGAAPANLGNALISYYKENDAKKTEMLPKLKEAGVNCELKKSIKKGYAKIIFLDLPE